MAIDILTKSVFGPLSRYRLEAWHTRDDTVVWAVHDAFEVDPVTPEFMAIVRQTDTVGEALAGFEVSRKDHLGILCDLGRAAESAGLAGNLRLMHVLVDAAMISRVALR